MNATIPQALAPYLQECISSRSLTLLTSVLDTPTNWLVTRLFHLALGGQPVTQIPSRGTSLAGPGYKVVFVSIWRHFELWNELCRKCGLNLPERLAAKQACYIDGLSATAAATSSLPSPTHQVIKLKSLTLKDLNDTISNAIQSTSGQNDTTKTIVILDGLDFLLACDPMATSTTVQQMLIDLQSKVHSTVVTCSADGPLLHNMDTSATPIEYEHGALVRILAYQARLVFQLRPLETGHSRDVGGTVRVSRGGAWESIDDGDGGMGRDLEEREWLYQVKTDGMVKVWGRGEA